MTKSELTKKLKALGKVTKAQRNRIVCSLIEHSRIQTTCMGYFYCSRCGDQVGDSLGGFYDPTDIVIVGHNCFMCRKNLKKLNWKDKLYAPNPFPTKTKRKESLK